MDRETLRAEVHDWVRANWDPSLELRAWRERLLEAGWAVPSWPTRWYGRGLPAWADDVVRGEIRRGPNNFFDIDILAELADAYDELGAGRTRAIVLCSDGKHFCAGADFSGRSGRTQRADGPHLYDIAARLFAQPLPVVAARRPANFTGS